MKSEFEIKDEIRKLKKWMPKKEKDKPQFLIRIDILNWVLDSDGGRT